MYSWLDIPGRHVQTPHRRQTPPPSIAPGNNIVSTSNATQSSDNSPVIPPARTFSPALMALRPSLLLPTFVLHTRQLVVAVAVARAGESITH